MDEGTDQEYGNYIWNLWKLGNEIMTPKYSLTPVSLYLPHQNQTICIVYLTILLFQ